MIDCEDMTTSPTPDTKLDPAALASVVPLKRVGTEEVGCSFCSLLVLMC